MDPIVSIFVACLFLLVAVVWVLFPFLVLGKLKRQQKTLDTIAASTKEQADFWKNRNVKID